MSATHPRIVLEIDPAINPIGGRLSVDGSAQRQFSGWIALTSEIQNAVTARHPPAAAARRTPHPRPPSRPNTIS